MVATTLHFATIITHPHPADTKIEYPVKGNYMPRPLKVDGADWVIMPSLAAPAHQLLLLNGRGALADETKSLKLLQFR
jgi:hypothetical protein